MRHWERARLTSICGFCATWIKKGDPMQIIAIKGIESGKVRCPNCAEGSAPTNLPPLEEK